MALPDPAPRTKLHRRALTIEGYDREDGLLDIEGHIVDTKTYAFSNDWRGDVKPGMPVHEMWIRLTIDEKFLIHDVEATTDFGPFPPCHDVAPNFKNLKGLRLGPGWNRKMREKVGGTKGCTHIVEMLAQVATVAYQTMVKRYEDGKRAREARGEPKPAVTKKPPVIGTCHALAEDGPVVRRWWPEFYTGPDMPSADAEDAPNAKAD